MKAMGLKVWNGPYVLEDRPIPDVGPPDVLVKVKACGDEYIRTQIKFVFW